jgi:hypothetical protein
MQRQSVVKKNDPIKVWAIVDEAALRREVGGPEVMANQLRHLAESARQPHISLQVLPYRVGAHPGMHGAFAVMDFPDAADPELVYIESMAGALFLEREADVRRYTGVFEYLRAQALSFGDSIELVNDLARGGVGT